MTDVDGTELRGAYGKRPRREAGVELPPETVHALADGSYVGKDREALLEQVLRDPATAAEFHFLHDVARTARVPASRPWWQGVRGLALAAGGAITVALASQVMTGEKSEGPLRGGGPGLTLWSPADGVPAMAGSPVTFTWAARAEAVEYELTIAGVEGGELVRRSGADTTLMVAVPSGATSWWVTARQPDGTVVRSPTRALGPR